MTPADFPAEEMSQTLVEMAYSMIGNMLVPDKSPGKPKSKRAPARGPGPAVASLAKADGAWQTNQATIGQVCVPHGRRLALLEWIALLGLAMGNTGSSQIRSFPPPE
jgi:hypothetical protein